MDFLRRAVGHSWNLTPVLKAGLVLMRIPMSKKMITILMKTTAKKKVEMKFAMVSLFFFFPSGSESEYSGEEDDDEDFAEDDSGSSMYKPMTK